MTVAIIAHIGAALGIVRPETRQAVADGIVDPPALFRRSCSSRGADRSADAETDNTQTDATAASTAATTASTATATTAATAAAAATLGVGWRYSRCHESARRGNDPERICEQQGPGRQYSRHRFAPGTT